MMFFSYEKIGLWTTLNTFRIVILPLIIGHRTRFSASIRTLDTMTRNRLFNLLKTQVEDWYSEVLGDPRHMREGNRCLLAEVTPVPFTS